MKIAVLFGGISAERNVSIEGGKAVVEALRKKGHEVIPVDPAFGDDLEKQKSLETLINDISRFPTNEELAEYDTTNILRCISSSIFDDIDCVFIVLHGKNGEDGLIQATLELRNIPYTGTGVRGSATSINKIATKFLMESSGILSPEWAMIGRDDLEDYDLYGEIRNYLGDNLIVKPNDQGSTIGLTHLTSGNLDDLKDACVIATEYSKIALVEKFIEGREVTVSIIDDKAYPVIEILPQELYDYEAKYTGTSTQYVCPPELDENLCEFIQEIALRLHELLGCQGFTRVDFILDDDLQPYCLEINTIPGFTSHSLVPMAAKEAGLNFEDLCETIVNIAIREHAEKRS